MHDVEGGESQLFLAGDVQSVRSSTCKGITMSCEHVFAVKHGGCIVTATLAGAVADVLAS